MNIPISPFVIAASCVSFFVRKEVLQLTRSEHGFFYADIAFALCFAISVIAIAGLVYISKYDETKLFRIKATVPRVIEILVLLTIAVAYLVLLMVYFGDTFLGRFSILIVPIPILVLVYLLEWKWLNEV